MFKIKRIITVYFSPTHTTEKVVKAIASGTGIKKIIDYNMTLGQEEDIVIKKGDLLVIGGPVYVGRIPTIAVKRMKKIIGSGQPVICVAVYGNNRVGNALAELSSIMSQANLIPVAGASFIGEHSYSNEEYPIAKDRPNKVDINKAKEFGQKVMNKMHGQLKKIEFPGEIPTEPMPTLPLTQSIATEHCVMCSRCIDVCPTGAIDDDLICDSSKCIICFACVKSCEYNARRIESPRIIDFSKFLVKLEDKEPEFYC